MPKPSPDPRIQLLPGTLRPVAEACGFEAVERLIEVYGGTRLYVPAGAVSAAIAGQCGQAVAEALRREFGGDYAVLPRARTLQAAKRREQVRKDDRPANVIARELGITAGAVYRMRGDRPGPANMKAPPKKPGRPRHHDERQIDIEDLLGTRRRG